MEGSFHRRELKEPAVSFSSPEGKRLFEQALQEGHLEGYFHLAEHYITQGHPAFCGVGSLTMALNSLLLDPGRVWQGVWRWFDESMLDCCEPLDIVKLNGITLPKLSCLARCNGAHSTLKYGSDVTLEEFRDDVVTVSAIPAAAKSTCAPDGGCQKNEPTGTHEGEGCCGANSKKDKPCMMGSDRQVMIVSYCRSNLNQTGTGHFSPIGGYCAVEDMVLIMDVARFKYPPHWVPLPTLYAAMQAIDPVTKRSRGYMLLRALPEMEHRCDCSSICTGIASNNETVVALEVDDAKVACKEMIEPVVVASAATDSGPACIRTIQALPSPNPSDPIVVIKDETTTPSARLRSLIGHNCPNCS